ncbi:MAG: hypothetical protein AB8H80_02455, partial [Planctomycetota bacterium]
MPQLTSAATAAGASIANSAALRAAVDRIYAGDDAPTIVTRPASEFEIRRTIQEVALHGQSYAKDLAHRSRRPDPVDAILRVLKLSSTYRQKTQFDNAASMAVLRQKLTDAVAGRKALALTLPLGGGKVPNPAKAGRSYLPDVAEWVAWARLAAIARAIATVADLPARVLVVPDAPLHTADLGIPAVEAAAHLTAAHRDITALGLDAIVTIADTANHMPTRWSDEVALRAKAASQRSDHDPAFRKSVMAQVQSLLFATNLRVYPWSDERKLQVLHALASDADAPKHILADAAMVRADVERKVFWYTGTNHALRTLAIPDLLVAQHFGKDHVMIRLTVHAKPGEPQPLLVPPSRMARPGLLPMHGIGL